MALEEIGVDAGFLAVPVGGGEAHFVEHPPSRSVDASAHVLDRSVNLGHEPELGRERRCGKSTISYRMAKLFYRFSETSSPWGAGAFDELRNG